MYMEINIFSIIRTHFTSELVLPRATVECGGENVEYEEATMQVGLHI